MNTTLIGSVPLLSIAAAMGCSMVAIAGGNRRVFSPLPGDAQRGVVDAVPREILAFVLAYFLHDEWLGVSIPFSAVLSAGAAAAAGRCQDQRGWFTVVSQWSGGGCLCRPVLHFRG